MAENLELIKCAKRVLGVVPKYSCWQMRCFVFALNHLQPYFDTDIDWMSFPTRKLENKLNFNEFSEFEVPIDINRIDRDTRHGTRILNEIKEMMEVFIPFEYVKNGVRKFTAFRFIHRMSLDDNGNLTVYLSNFSVRWALEYQKEKGFLTFHKDSVLCLSSSYHMNLAMLFGQWYNPRIFKKSIEELIKILECPHYTPQNLEDKILFPAFHEMLNKKECVYAFKYRFVKEKAEGRKGRKGFAEIEFKIYDKRKSNFYEEFYNDDWQDRVKQDKQNK